MIIGIDIDNVLNNLSECTLAIYTQDSGDNLKESDITEYNISKFIKEEYRKDFYKYFSDERVRSMLKGNLVAAQTIRKWKDKGYTIYLISATHPLNVGWKYEITQKLYPNLFEWYDYIWTSNKHQFNLDVLIDDCLDNFHEFPDRFQIVLDKPWNQTEEYYVHRCKDWNEIDELIREVTT